MTIKIRPLYTLNEDDLDRELSTAISSEMQRKAWEAVCGVLNRMQAEIDDLREQLIASTSTSTSTPAKKATAAAKADAAE